MSFSALSHSFTVNEVTSTTDTNTFLNILRRREKFAYKTRVQPSEVGLSYVGSEAISSNKTLFIADKSSDLVANRIGDKSQFLVVPNIQQYTIETDNFTVTDIFTDPSNTVTKVPLFFNHVISIDNLPRVSVTDKTINGAVKLLSVDVVDRFFNAIQTSEIKIDLDKGIIYNNLTSSYDPSDGSVVMYYVRYSVRSGNQVVSYLEVLNNTNVYTVATFDDLTNLLTIKLDGRKVYLIEENISGGYNITLPTLSTYAFVITTSAKIQIVPPVGLDAKAAWLVEISNATVFNGVYKYYIAEFLNQNWNPLPPFKMVVQELSTVVDKNLVKTNRQNVHEDVDSLEFLSLQINDSNGNGVAAFTTSPHLAGSLAENGEVYYKWSSLTRKGIRSIDYKTGFIDIDGLTLKSNYQVLVDYYFVETNYEFALIDFNPLDNPSILDQRVVIFLDPDLITTLAKSQTLYYLITDRTGKVTQSNWYNFDNNSQTVRSNGHQLYYDSIPAYASMVPAIDLFVNTYSLEGSGQILILGELYVNENSAPSKSTYIDVRQSGGGLRKDKVDSVQMKNDEAQWYWDLGFFDGIPYPGNASYFVEVPTSVLEGAGGTFHTNLVRDIVARHTAAGVYPVIRAYGIDPLIDQVVPGATTLTLKWRSYGPTVSYKVFTSSSETGPWTENNSVPVSDNSAGNTYVITGLANGAQYYFFVVGGRLDSEGTWIPVSGQPIGPDSSSAIGITNPNMMTAKTYAPGTNQVGSQGNTFTVV